MDSAGRMVGMTTSSFVTSNFDRSSGINFAVPVDTLVASVPKLILTGSASGRGMYSRAAPA